jgi:DNA-binding transcriptional MocR family regulator
LLQLAESLGLNIVEIPMNPRDGMCLDSLENLLNRHQISACVGVLNFNNPLGCLMPNKNKKRLVMMLEERNIPLIENDIYGDLYFGSGRPINAKSFEKKGLVMLCSSVSKSLAPGYRVGWAAAGKFKEAVEQIQLVSTLSPPTLQQMIVAEFMHNGSYDRHLNRLRNCFADQVKSVSIAINEYFPANTGITRPQGGFVLWVELPKKIDSTELQKKAFAERISINSGTLFSVRDTYKNFIRISCGQPWSDKLKEAVIKLGRLTQQLLEAY